jgi:DNA-binding transcriptional LysR family regulator
MIKYDLNLDYLKTFLIVAASGSMHRAAEECHLTQPAVTRQMALLARGVGAEIFVKFGRGVRLTPAGTQLMAEARGIFQTIEEGMEKVREKDGQARKRILLGASHYVALNGLARPVREFRMAYPGIGITLFCGSSEEVIGKVKTGELDLGVATLPDHSEGLSLIRLWTDTFVAALPVSHPLSKKTEVTLDELAKADLVLPPTLSTTRNLIDSVFRKGRIRPLRFTEMNTLETIAAGVDMSLGVAILPLRMLERTDRTFPQIAVRPIREFHGSRDLGILSKTGRPVRVHEKPLIRELEKNLGEISRSAHRVP